MGQVAADGAPVANLWMGDMRKRVSKQRARFEKIAIALERTIARHGADPDVPLAPIDRGEFGKTIDVDQHRRPRQAEIHRRNEALAASEEPGFVAMLGFQAKRLIKGRSPDVFEGSRLHWLPRKIPLDCLPV